MKNSSIILLAITLCLLWSCNQKDKRKKELAMVSFNSASQPIPLYPAAKKLDEVKGLIESDIFTVAVNEVAGFVYKTFETRDKQEHKKQKNSISYQGVSFFNFEMDAPTATTITSIAPAKNWKVMPTLEKSDIKTSANSITINLKTPMKLVVSAEINGVEEFMILSAEPPETRAPNKNDSTVLYLGPGVHRYGQAWDPFTNGIKTLYVAGGAVLEATIKSKNKQGVKILGRGVISQSFTTHAEESSKEQEWDADWLGVVFIDSKNIEIDGVTIMSSPSYQLEVSNCENVIINNVKLCGFGEHNNDGIHTYSKNVLVQDTFIASNDDRICITGLYDAEEGTDDIHWDGTNKLKGVPVSNIHIKDVVFWGLDNNGGDIMLTWNGAGYAKDILIENTVSLTGTNKAFIAARHGGSADINNLKIKNAKLFHGNLFDIEIGESNYQGAGGGKIRDMVLENIEIDANLKDIGKQLLGQSTNSGIFGIQLKNIISKDGKLESIDDLQLTKNKFVTDITVTK